MMKSLAPYADFLDAEYTGLGQSDPKHYTHSHKMAMLTPSFIGELRNVDHCMCSL